MINSTGQQIKKKMENKRRLTLARMLSIHREAWNSGHIQTGPMSGCSSEFSAVISQFTKSLMLTHGIEFTPPPVSAQVKTWLQFPDDPPVRISAAEWEHNAYESLTAFAEPE
jgi:hypothetical protein